MHTPVVRTLGVQAIEEADVIITTPEKWDGVSRSWQVRSYVQDVALIIMDEVCVNVLTGIRRESVYR